MRLPVLAIASAMQRSPDMAALVLNVMAIIFALDAAFVACLAGRRCDADPVALRMAVALSVVLLAGGACCAAVARLA